MCTSDNTKPTSKRDIGDYMRGVLHGSLGAFAGFLFGAFIAAIFALEASAPTWAPAMPYVAAIGGLAFGFAEGVTNDLQ